ncbi:MAG: HEAT repeat domain-containing protein [Planctomycetes bacterium]|nr:HEAT repeat domain-containing protein [Planctomycetota bacterium]
MRAARRSLEGAMLLVGTAGLAFLLLEPGDPGETLPSPGSAAEGPELLGGAPDFPPCLSGAPDVESVAGLLERPSTAREPAAIEEPVAAHSASGLLVLISAALGEGLPDEEDPAAIEAQELAESALEELRDRSLAPELARIARDHPDAGHRILAADILVDLDPQTARTISIAMLRCDSDAGARQSAVVQIANLSPDPEGLDALRLALVQDPASSVRQAAALALARLLGEDALADLRQASELEGSPAVRRTLESAIGVAAEARPRMGASHPRRPRGDDG